MFCYSTALQNRCKSLFRVLTVHLMFTKYAFAYWTKWQYAENPGIIYHAGTQSISSIKMKGSDNFQTAFLELEGFLNG